MPSFHMPKGVLGMAERDADWADWVDRLPRMAEDLLTEWELTSDGWSMHGYASIVIPVRRGDGSSAVLKITNDHDDESEFEHLALRTWDGHGAIRLLAADPRRRALLLERAEAEDLRDVWDLEACEIVAGLYPSLHQPPLPQLRTLTSYFERWLDEMEEIRSEMPVPPRMVEQALALGRDLVTDPASTGRIIHGDLHYYNVMRTDRGWVAIDPKPMNGDPHYEVPPMLWNRWEEMEAPTSGQSLRHGIRRRFHTLVDAAGLDEARVRDWTIVRMVVDASWTVLDARRAARRLDEDEQMHVTRSIAIVKAVQE